jgi:hypothetical protein
MPMDATQRCVYDMAGNGWAEDICVARGLAPVRLRSSRKSSRRDVSEKTLFQHSGPLRSPTGASPLATKAESGNELAQG